MTVAELMTVLSNVSDKSMPVVMQDSEGYVSSNLAMAMENDDYIDPDDNSASPIKVLVLSD